MVIRQEQIEELLSKVNISYEEAEKILKKTNGDIRKAVERIEKKQSSEFRRTMRNLKNSLIGILKYRLIILRKNETLINLPIIVILLLYVFIFDYIEIFEMFLLLLIVLLADCKVKIEKTKKEKDNEKEKEPIIIKASEQTPVANENNGETLEVIEEDGYNEIVVED